MNRFDRQIKLQDFGIEGQNKLRQSSALIVGVGGLGCPALLYMAAAGIGKIGIADGDVVSISNLNRQVIYGEKDEDRKKVDVAAEVIRQKYSDIQLVIFPEFIHTGNALEIISQFDIVVDCSDNFSARYMINDACVLLQKPLVYGAIFEYEGQVSLFNVKNEKGISCNYRDLFPIPPESNQIPDCNETGVLGVLPGIIGTLQATETIKYLSNTGSGLSGKILYYNIKQSHFFKLNVMSNPQASKYIPDSEAAFRDYDYSSSCTTIKYINWHEAQKIYSSHSNQTVFIDVREKDELPKMKSISFVQLPLSRLYEDKQYITNMKNLLVYCKSGIRSEKAASILKKIFPDKNIYSITGGILDKLSPLNNPCNEI